jgi:hypothetical protein
LNSAALPAVPAGYDLLGSSIEAWRGGAPTEPAEIDTV